MKELERLDRMHGEGKLSRREFLNRVSALTAAGVVLPSALLSEVARAQSPKQGGRLRMGMVDATAGDNFDPAKTISRVEIVTTQQLRNPLVELDHESKPTDSLAESWEASADAKTWRFNLRKDVEFHNGKTMDSEDVLYSVNYHRGEDSTSAAKTLLEAVTEVRADGKHAVVFELSGGNADFPYIMSDYHIQMVPTGVKGQEFDEGIGTGAYMLVEHDPGTRILCKRNPNYWNPNRGHFDEVETLGINDTPARTNALRTDEIDVMNEPDVKTVHLLAQDPNLETAEVIGTQHYTLPMDTTIAPFDNNDVRTALKYAINREEIVDKVLRGHGLVGNDQPIGPANRYHDATLEQRAYDPDRAKHHLKKAGLDKLAVQLHTADAAFTGAIDTALLYSGHAKAAGIDIEVIRVPDDGYWNEVWMSVPWCASIWFGRPTEDMMFSTAYADGAAWNASRFSHERFNSLLVEARAELDDAKRREMYTEMQRILRDEGGEMVPMFSSIITAHSTKVAHGPVSGNAIMDGLRLPERWWFA